MKKIILAVDDDKGSRTLLKRSLEDRYEVIATKNAQEASKVLQEQCVDLIISDINMPQTDGLDFCKWLRSQPETKDIPLLFATCYNSPEDIQRGLETGANDYLTKPIHPIELNARVSATLATKQLQELSIEAAKLKAVKSLFVRLSHDINNALSLLMLVCKNHRENFSEKEVDKVNIAFKRIHEVLSKVENLEQIDYQKYGPNNDILEVESNLKPDK